jgi:ankyrin repeat protein
VALNQAQVTLMAMRLCCMQGLVVSSADEVLDERSGETMLMRQAALSNTTTVRLLFDAGARPDAADAQGQTLMYAAFAGQRETALALVSARW